MTEKMERPLRSRMHSDPEWSKLKQYEADFGRATKSYDDAIVKHLKAIQKSGKSSGKSDKLDKKVSDTASAKEAAKLQWIPQATEAFQRFQLMDETRLASLKEVLAKYADLGVRHEGARSALADGVLAATLGFDVTNETTTFCVAKGNNDGSAPTLPAGTMDSAATSRDNSVVGLPDGGVPSRHMSSNVLDVKPTVDEEGYTIPPGPANVPWDTPNGAPLDEGDNMDGDGSNSSPQRIKMAIQKEAIRENPEDANKALRQFQNVLGPSTSKLAKRGSRRISYVEGARPDGSSDAGSARRPMTLVLGNPDGGSSPGSITDMFSTDSPSSSVVPSLEPQRTGNSPASQYGSPASGPAQIHASVSEQVNALLRASEVDKLLLMGELALNSSKGFADLIPGTKFHIRVENYDQLAQVVPNETYVKVVSTSQPDHFEVDASALRDAAASTVVILKYQVRITESANYVPLTVQPIWKCEANQASLMLVYQLNPGLRDRVQLADVSLLVPIEGGGDIGLVQMKPQGVWNPERKAILWKVGKLGGGETDGEQQKILARIETTRACTPSTVAVRFTCAGALLSGIGISAVPGAQNPARVELDTALSFSAGKYGAA
ncbi:hypothetical protein HKX48_000754 [Thoreauomyces humboldtii]|nr:hypothetical protein HKX48_000754 [Thoreauomyces humboldtii]